MTLSALGFPHLRSDDDQRRRNLAFDRAIVQDRMALAAVDTENFPLGWYVLLDGRRVYGHNDLELRAMARESWRVQRLADFALEVRLDALRAVAGPLVASATVFYSSVSISSGVTADLFAAVESTSGAMQAKPTGLSSVGGGDLSRTNVRSSDRTYPHVATAGLQPDRVLLDESWGGIRW